MILVEFHGMTTIRLCAAMSSWDGFGANRHDKNRSKGHKSRMAKFRPHRRTRTPDTIRMPPLKQPASKQGSTSKAAQAKGETPPWPCSSSSSSGSSQKCRVDCRERASHCLTRPAVPDLRVSRRVLQKKRKCGICVRVYCSLLPQEVPQPASRLTGTAVPR